MNRQVYETHDYSIFRFVRENRKIDSKHVARLMESIKEKNLTKDFPIIVNSNMEIIEGQHRYEACKQLEYPVCYIIAQEIDKSDISKINTVSKKWSLEDFLHQYTQKDIIDYIKFKDFIEYSKCKSVTKALRLLSNKKLFTSDGDGISDDVQYNFKTGNYKYPNDDIFAKKKVYELNEISKYTERKNPFCTKLMAVYDTLTSDPNFNYNRLITKLKQKELGIYSKAESLMDNINTVYNYACSNNQPQYYFKLKRGR